MWVQKKKNRYTINAILAVFLCQLIACTDCEDYISRSVAPRQGSVKVDTIYHKWGDRAYTVANNATGEKLLYYDDDFPVKAQVGDSLVKKKGESEYTLYTKDSVYVQRFDCAKRRGIIISQTPRVIR